MWVNLRQNSGFGAKEDVTVSSVLNTAWVANGGEAYFESEEVGEHYGGSCGALPPKAWGIGGHVTVVSSISESSFRQLHPNTIEDEAEIRTLLRRAWATKTVLRRSTNRRIEAEEGIISSVTPDSIWLTARNFEFRNEVDVFLNLVLDGRPYFFSTRLLDSTRRGSLQLQIPRTVYFAERRDRVRIASAQPERTVAIDTEYGKHVIGKIEDQSADGLGVIVPAGSISKSDSYRSIQMLSEADPQIRRYAKVANWGHESANGWQRIGLSVTSGVPGQPVVMERSDSLKGVDGAGLIRRSLRIVQAEIKDAAQRLSDRVLHVDRPLPKIEVVEFKNYLGERIRAIVDSYGETRGAPAVVIPPAWGKTKETLLPLAATIVSTFREVGEPVVVLRFDGIRKRGESHLDPECLEPGAENTRFTFSQGVEDIHSALGFLESAPQFKPSRSILVSFSGASIDSRRAVATDRSGRLCAWISVVGAGDLQSMMRIISGGVDYLGGVSRGIRFGFQDILGLLVDVDTSCRDALDHRMAFLEDSRCDFSSISVPVTWIHGRYDAWMDASRARHVLSFGNQGNRRFIEIPTGHQLRSSSEAMSAFGLVAQEAGRFLLGRLIEPTPPSLFELKARLRAERNRLPRRTVEVREFWERYLLGGNSHIGMELLTSTFHYRNFMRIIVEELQLQPGARVLDLGAGTGTLAQTLIREQSVDALKLEVLQVDYVRRALQRARKHCTSGSRSHFSRTIELVGDLEMGGKAAYLPLADRSVDRIAATLLLNYLRNPDRLLSEARRVLRPGGRMVITTLRPDADISRICVDGAAELRQGLAQHEFGEAGVRHLDESIRNVISDAARILDFEEIGLFRFWDKTELLKLIRVNGFQILSVRSIFGSPPQAVSITAIPF